MVSTTLFHLRECQHDFYHIIFWLNSFPTTGGVSETLSPCRIIIGIQLGYAKHCCLEFGTHAQFHEEHDNSMTAHTTPPGRAIKLHPTGNTQGGYYLFSLTTGWQATQPYSLD